MASVNFTSNAPGCWMSPFESIECSTSTLVRASSRPSTRWAPKRSSSSTWGRRMRCCCGGSARSKPSNLLSIELESAQRSACTAKVARVGTRCVSMCSISSINCWRFGGVAQKTRLCLRGFLPGSAAPIVTIILLDDPNERSIARTEAMATPARPAG